MNYFAIFITVFMFIVLLVREGKTPQNIPWKAILWISVAIFAFAYGILSGEIFHYLGIASAIMILSFVFTSAI